MLRRIVARAGMLSAFVMIALASACADSPVAPDSPDDERCYEVDGMIVCER
ncbi:MAG: hypothetical protein ACRELV_02910 [Longimicrobiales bacterium]